MRNNYLMRYGLSGIFSYFAIVLLSLLIELLSISPALSQDKNSEILDQLPEIDRTFIIETDENGSFSYNETDEGIIAIWEGKVVAHTEQIIIETERLELEMIGDNRIKSLKALPSVTIQLTQDQAQAKISGDEFVFDFETQSGHVRNSVIEIHVSPDAFDLPSDRDYRLFILAETTDIVSNDISVENPELRLNSITDPEITFECHSLTIDTYNNRRYAHVKKPSFKLFGLRILTYPWTYHRALTSKSKHGFVVEIPRLGTGASGFEIDQKFTLAMSGGILKNKFYTFRTDIFTNDRWYPEIGLSDDSGLLLWDIWYGYERGEDIIDKKILVTKKPDFNLKLAPQVILKKYEVKTGLDYGIIEEPSRNADSDRLGFNFSVRRKPIPLGSQNCNLEFDMEYKKSFYSDDMRYEVFTRGIGIKHTEKNKFSLGVKYYMRDDKGESPFLHDREKILDELNLRSRWSLSENYGIGIDGRYDLDKDHFRDLEFLVTKIFNSFQMSVGWDFSDSQAEIEFGLPGFF